MSFGDEFGGFFGVGEISDWENYERAIVDWIAQATGFPAGKVVRSNQDGPRPAPPFVEVSFGGLVPLGAVDAVENFFDVEADPGAEVVQLIRGQRELDVTVRAYTVSAVGIASARAVLSLCQLALRTDTTRARLSDLGNVTVFDNGVIRAIPAVLGAKWEGRAELTCRFYVEETLESRTGYIAAVEATNQIPDPDRTFTTELEE